MKSLIVSTRVFSKQGTSSQYLLFGSSLTICQLNQFNTNSEAAMLYSLLFDGSFQFNLFIQESLFKKSTLAI